MGRSPSRPNSPTTEIAPVRYRPNVCAVIQDSDTGRVLVFRRTDRTLGSEAWQFPQGGVQAGESPGAAVIRELAEEIGTGRVEILAQSAETIRYEFPPGIAERLSHRDPAKRGFGGQEQTWFLARLLDGESSIRLPGPEPEFDSFRWVSPEQALDGIVSFKKDAYRQGLRALGLIH